MSAASRPKWASVLWKYFKLMMLFSFRSCPIFRTPTRIQITFSLAWENIEKRDHRNDVDHSKSWIEENVQLPISIIIPSKSFGPNRNWISRLESLKDGASDEKKPEQQVSGSFFGGFKRWLFSGTKRSSNTFFLKVRKGLLWTCDRSREKAL